MITFLPINTDNDRIHTDKTSLPIKVCLLPFVKILYLWGFVPGWTWCPPSKPTFPSSPLKIVVTSIQWSLIIAVLCRLKHIVSFCTFLREASCRVVSLPWTPSPLKQWFVSIELSLITLVAISPRINSATEMFCLELPHDLDHNS